MADIIKNDQQKSNVDTQPPVTVQVTPYTPGTNQHSDPSKDRESAFENAKMNLKSLGSVLGLNDLVYDKDNSCVLSVDTKYTLHLKYSYESKKLYIFSPVLEKLPTKPTLLVKLYETILDGTFLGGKTANGTIGINKESSLALIHWVLDMGNSITDSLVSFTPIMMDQIEKWRNTLEYIVAQELAQESTQEPSSQPSEKS